MRIHLTKKRKRKDVSIDRISYRQFHKRGLEHREQTKRLGYSPGITSGAYRRIVNI